MNFSYIQNLTGPDLGLNDTLQNDNYLSTMVTTANDVSQGYLGLVIMLLSFAAIFVILNNPIGDSRLGTIQSLFVSSGISTIIGMVMLISGLIVSLQHVIWMLVIFAVLFFMVLNIKKKTG